MTATERRATVGLAGIFGLRLLGMFIILPVLALYAETLPGGASPLLLGIALGVYGLTQAVLQIPFGWASDRWGRKPVIYRGLVDLRAGSLIAAWAPTSAGSSPAARCRAPAQFPRRVIAMAADLTRDEVRTARDGGHRHHHRHHLRAVAGRGPVLTRAHRRARHLRADRRAGAGRDRTASRIVPNPGAVAGPRADSPAQWRACSATAHLLRLNYGIFALHAALMALFVQVPFALRDNGVAAPSHWLVYLPVLVGSVAADAAGALRRPIVRRRSKPIFVGAVAVLFAGQVLLAVAGTSLPLTVVGARRCSSPDSICSRQRCPR